MSEAAIKDFLDQFAASKDKINQWPTWMRDSAKFSTASFPKPPLEEAKKSAMQPQQQPLHS